MSTSKLEAAYFIYRIPTISDSDHGGQLSIAPLSAR
jgi:hypothetical protein